MLQMAYELGRSARVFMKDGSAFNFKPLEYHGTFGVVIGLDEYNFRRKIKVYDIEGVIYFKNVKWR